MASVGSRYSGSPESKSTLHTPENGPYDNYHNLTTPSDLRLSPIIDSYAEWNALPSRLLESPPPEITTVQFHDHSALSEKMVQNTKTKSSTFRVGEVLGNHHPSVVEVLVDSSIPEMVSCLHPTNVEHYLENNKAIEAAQGLSDIFSLPSESLLDFNLSPTEWSPAQTRHLKICNISSITSLVILYKAFQEFGDIQEFYTQKLPSDGFCVVSYFDIRDSVTAYQKLQTEHLLGIQFCSSGYVTMLVMGTNLSGRGVDNRAEIICIVTSGGHSSNTRRILYCVLSDFSAISKFTAVENSSPPAFLVTFFDIRDAFDIIDTLDGQYVEGLRLKLSFYDSDILTWDCVFNGFNTRRDENDRIHFSTTEERDIGIFCPQPLRPATEFCRRVSGTGSLDSGFGLGRESERFMETLYSSGYVTQKGPGLTIVNPEPNQGPSLRNPSICPPDSRQSQKGFIYLPSKSHETDTKKTRGILKSVPPSFPFQLFGNTMSPTATSGRSHSQMQVPGKNVIDLERISRGLDTRTTVMLRNIPNKVDQQTLKDYVDTTSKNLYNFLYLRIDFRNICNVGYAFINFMDPLDIINFVKAKSGTRWNKFNSEKVLDVTYANIQGIDQLVEKFRNSSVMDQDPSYRPKLFHSSGPFTGTEMEFPPANNILKKCRSISAAQQIGLFAPKMSTTGKGIWRKRE